MDAAAQATINRDIYQLQQDAVHGVVAVSALLRRALLLTRAKNDATSETWIRQELEGEGWAKAIPPYRVVHGHIQAQASNRAWIRVACDDPRFADVLEKRELETSVPEIEELLARGDAGTGFHLPLPAGAEVALGQLCNVRGPTPFRFSFGRSALDRILSAVRNRLLDWTMRFVTAANTNTQEQPMTFQSMMTDTLSLTRDGKAISARFKGSVSPQKGIITTFEAGLRIQEGDIYVRHLSNGDTEQWEVLEPGFHEKFHSIPAGYDSKVQKVTNRPRPPAIPSSINIHGDNARVNLHSVDHSTNTVSTTVAVEFWGDLNAAIQQIPEPARTQLATGAAALKDAQGKPGFGAAWASFMANAANHVTALGPLFPKLAAMFTGGGV